MKTRQIKLLKDIIKNFILDNTNNDFERLEFLGDRVLGLTIAHFLFKTFLKTFSDLFIRKVTNLNVYFFDICANFESWNQPRQLIFWNSRDLVCTWGEQDLFPRSCFPPRRKQDLGQRSCFPPGANRIWGLKSRHTAFAVRRDFEEFQILFGPGGNSIWAHFNEISGKNPV